MFVSFPAPVFVFVSVSIYVYVSTSVSMPVTFLEFFPVLIFVLFWFSFGFWFLIF